MNKALRRLFSLASAILRGASLLILLAWTIGRLFTEVLRQELRGRGIAVSVLLPPDTDTPQLAEENREKPAATRALAGNVPVLAPEAVADALLEGLASGRAVIVPGWRARATLWAARLAPGLVRRIIDREIARAGG